MPTCSCNLVGMLSTSLPGVFAANIDGSTTVEVSDEGVVLLGATINTLSISAYAFTPGGDWFLGVSCASSAQAQIEWVQKYDCFNDKMYFIPKSGGKASIVGGPINGVTLECDPGIVSDSFSASAQSGPATPYITTERRDGFNLRYTGIPIPIESGSPRSYDINLGFINIKAYLQNFSISIAPPQPATVNYSFVFTT